MMKKLSVYQKIAAEPQALVFGVSRTNNGKRQLKLFQKNLKLSTDISTPGGIDFFINVARVQPLYKWTYLSDALFGFIWLQITGVCGHGNRIKSVDQAIFNILFIQNKGPKTKFSKLNGRITRTAQIICHN